jgi:hypothetical protein
MQRMGGGKQRGGGNDPTCGCDMQAGWPPASELPRGGLQGGGSLATPSHRGGNWNFNEFNLALTKNGKTRHLKGKWNNNNSNQNMNMNINNNMNMNTMNNGNNKNRNKTNKKRVSSAPNGYSNLAYKGKKYYKKTNSGEVFEITKNGTLGKSMGFYVTPKSGKPYLTQMPPPLENETLEQPINRLSQPITPVSKTESNNNSMRTQLPPEIENSDTSVDYESEAPEGEQESTMRSLSQNGGKRKRRTHKRKHSKRMTKRRR